MKTLPLAIGKDMRFNIISPYMYFTTGIILTYLIVVKTEIVNTECKVICNQDSVSGDKHNMNELKDVKNINVELKFWLLLSR